MGLQLMTRKGKNFIDLSACTFVHRNENIVILLIKFTSLTKNERKILLNKTGLVFSMYDTYSGEVDSIKTKDHFIRTSVVNEGSERGLSEDQWLIEFEI